MSDERTIPLLPCGSIDELTAFYETLGFDVTHRQQRPNPYAIVRREDLELHFFGMADFDPEQSYGSCLVVVRDVARLHAAFAAGLRAANGKLPYAGIPRMTRPGKNQHGVGGFTVVDPGGNWIRISQTPRAEPEADRSAPQSKLARVLAGAMRIGDSKGDKETAARVLDTALARGTGASVTDLVAALVYRAELAFALDDGARADALLAQVRELPLAHDERRQLEDAFAGAAELEQQRRTP